MSKILFCCFFALLLVFIPMREVFGQPVSCSTCKTKGPYPYSYCNGSGGYTTVCTPCPWCLFPGSALPLHQQMPPCFNIDAGGILTTSYGYYQSWRDSVYFDEEIDNDTTVKVPIMESVTVFNSDLTVLNGDASWAMSQWTGICHDTLSGYCCANVTFSYDPSVFSFPLKDYAETYVTNPGDSCTICGSNIVLNGTYDFDYGDTLYPNRVPYTGYILPVILDDYDSDGVDIGQVKTNFWSVRTTLLHEYMHYFGLPSDANFESIDCYPRIGGDTAIDVQNVSMINDNSQEPLGLSSYDSCWYELLYCCREATGVNENINALPETEPLLLSNAPNPFTDATTINYTVGTGGHVVLRVFNAIGESVATLQNANIAAGSYTAVFDGMNMAKGVYYYVLTEGKAAAVRGMILVK